MKNKNIINLILLCTSAALAQAQGAAFTYQGRLAFNDSPANGSYDLRFIPFNSSEGGSQAGPILTNSATALSDGLFTVALDFGDLSFLGTNYWLEIAVRASGDGGFTTLSPRQPITCVPQAMTSATALTALGLAGVVDYNFVEGELYATVGGGWGNTNTGYLATIGGGSQNSVTDYAGTVGGGEGNLISSNYGTVGGGQYNTNNGNAATIAGGYKNAADYDYAVVGGGYKNQATRYAATVAGGYKNSAGYDYAAVGGGYDNYATNNAATVPGGLGNVAGGQYSFAAGRNARAPGHGSFVWNTYSKPNVLLGDHQFQIYAQHGFNVDYFTQRADGGGERWLYIGDNFPGNTLSVWNGANLTDAGVWANASDRNRKTDFQEVDSREILERLVAMPLREWRYTNESASVKHLGPTAQDFQEAFSLGDDDKSIGTVDADGVSLAAIQGLNRKVSDESKRRDADDADLRRELGELQQLVRALQQQLDGGAR